MATSCFNSAATRSARAASTESATRNTIFRTNIQGAYQVGRYKQMQAVKALREGKEPSLDQLLGEHTDIELRVPTLLPLNLRPPNRRLSGGRST